MKRANLLNKKFYKLSVISWDTNKSKWQCRCDCGNIRYCETAEFNRQRAKSCGCEYRYKKKRLPDNLGAKKHLLRVYRNNAKLRNIDFQLSEQEFYTFIERPCYYCHSLPSLMYQFTKYPHDLKINGIDRIDNTKGYVFNNCVTCCKICNISKQNLSLIEWGTWIEKIKANFDFNKCVAK